MTIDFWFYSDNYYFIQDENCHGINKQAKIWINLLCSKVFETLSINLSNFKKVALHKLHG